MAHIVLFLIERSKSMEFVSFSFSTYVNMDKPDVVKPCLCVAHDDEKETHHALQLVFENNIQVIGDEVRFYHHGRIAVGNRGSGRVDELRMFVEERYPEIVAGKRFYMGSLVNDRQWNIDEPDVIKLLERLITYALIRDEYRDFVKTNR